MKDKTQWLLFDFGGCLDSDGEHSRNLFKRIFEKNNIIKAPQDNEKFQEAYSLSDQIIIKKSLVKTSTLLKMNLIFCQEIFKFLSVSNRSKRDIIAKEITEEQSFFLKRNKEILRKLSEKYKLGIISNFSGNLNVILDEFELSPFFEFIIDSYHIGIVKPDLEIFKIAMIKCNVPADEIIYFGDNKEKDINPARALGMNAVLISSKKEKQESTYTLDSLNDLLVVSQSIYPKAIQNISTRR